LELEVLTAVEVGRLLKCSRSQVYKLRRSGLLPPPIQLFPGERGARWLRQDVVEFILQARTLAAAPAPRPFKPVDIRRN
jgi:predicted DNA-binding transcriptional regulator AlpA